MTRKDLVRHLDVEQMPVAHVGLLRCRQPLDAEAQLRVLLLLHHDVLVDEFVVKLLVVVQRGDVRDVAFTTNKGPPGRGEELLHGFNRHLPNMRRQHSETGVNVLQNKQRKDGTCGRGMDKPRACARRASATLQ